MLSRLNAHRAWANRLYVQWIAESIAGSTAEGTGALSGAHEYCLKMLSHVLEAEEVWLQRLRGAVTRTGIWDVLPPGALDPLRRENDAGWDAAMGLDLSRVLSYRRLDGTEMTSTLADIATHVCAHGVYHRGQIAARAARDGLPTPPSTDFILFAREYP